MKRREFFTLAGSAAAVWGLSDPRVAIARTSKVYRLGTLTPLVPMVSNAERGAILINTLAQRGYTLGKNLSYEARGAAGEVGQLPQLMQELKAAKVDVVVTTGYPATVAAKAFGIAVQALGIREPDDFNDAFAAMNRDMPDAILMVSDTPDPS